MWKPYRIMFPIKCRLLSWPVLPGLFPFPILPACPPALSLTEVLSLTEYTTPFLLQGLALAVLLLGTLRPCWACFLLFILQSSASGDLFSEASLYTHTHTVSIPLPLSTYTIFNSAFSPYLLMDHQLLLSLIFSEVSSMLIFFERTTYKMWTGEGYF